MPRTNALGSTYVTVGNTEDSMFVEVAKEKFTPSFRHRIQQMKNRIFCPFSMILTLLFQNPTIISVLPLLLQHLSLPKSQRSHEQLKPYCHIQKHRACFRHREAVSSKCLRQRKQVNLDFSYLQQQRAKERQSITTTSFSSNL